MVTEHDAVVEMFTAVTSEGTIGNSDKIYIIILWSFNLMWMMQTIPRVSPDWATRAFGSNLQQNTNQNSELLGIN